MKNKHDKSTIQQSDADILSVSPDMNVSTVISLTLRKTYFNATMLLVYIELGLMSRW